MKHTQRRKQSSKIRGIVVAVIAGISVIAAIIAIINISIDKKQQNIASVEYGEISQAYITFEDGDNGVFNGYRLVDGNNAQDIAHAGQEGDIKTLDTVPTGMESVPVPKPDHNGLKAKNPDYVCWLYIPGTPISYPVVSRDDSYYTEHTFAGTENPSGCLFIGQASDSVTYIYGHNMSNGTMFGLLKRVKETGTDEIWLIFPEGVKKFKIVSGHVTMVGGDVYNQPDSLSGLAKFIDIQQRSSERQYTATGFSDPPEVIVLSTCHGMPGGNGRYVLVGAR